MADDLIFRAFGGPDGGSLVKVQKGATGQWAYRTGAVLPEDAKASRRQTRRAIATCWCIRPTERMLSCRLTTMIFARRS